MTRAQTLQVIAERYRVRLDSVKQPIPVRAGRGDLPKLCRALGMTRGAEIGVWKGAFSELWCQLMPGVEWYAVDTWAPYAEYREAKNDPVLIAQAQEIATERLAAFDCRLLQLSSVEAAEQIPDGSLDVVYIDGNHEAPFVQQDLEAWTPKLRPGGILAGHDYREPSESKPFIQVKAAVDLFTKTHHIKPWFTFAADKTPSFFWVIP